MFECFVTPLSIAALAARNARALLTLVVVEDSRELFLAAIALEVFWLTVCRLIVRND